MHKKPKLQKRLTTRTRPDKKEAILAAAYDRFSDNGLGISVDEIAEHAGVAKQTVYTAFRDKLQLLAESSVHKYAVIAKTLNDDVAVTPRDMLHRVAERYYETALDERYIKFMNGLFLEQEKLRPIFNQIFNAGPEQNIKELAQYFERTILRKELDIKAPFLAAESFFGALKGYIRERYWFKHVPPPTGREMQARIDYIVDLFIKAYEPQTVETRKKW